MESGPICRGRRCGGELITPGIDILDYAANRCAPACPLVRLRTSDIAHKERTHRGRSLNTDPAPRAPGPLPNYCGVLIWEIFSPSMDRSPSSPLSLNWKASIGLFSILLS